MSFDKTFASKVLERKQFNFHDCKCFNYRKKNKQDMTVPFARARAKLGGSIRQSDVTVKVIII